MKKGKSKFYNFVRNKKDNTASLYIYGEITPYPWSDADVSANEFRKELEKIQDVDTLNVYINSPGGAIFEAFAIYNQLVRFGQTHKINVWIDGLAASSASLIALAGHKIHMPKNAYFMIHRAWTIALGNSKDFLKTAEELEQLDTTIAEIYQNKTNLPLDEIIEYMDEETWFDGKQAYELGFIDVLEEEKQIAASIKNMDTSDINVLNKYKNIPDRVKEIIKNKEKDNKDKSEREASKGNELELLKVKLQEEIDAL